MSTLKYYAGDKQAEAVANAAAGGQSVWGVTAGVWLLDQDLGRLVGQAKALGCLNLTVKGGGSPLQRIELAGEAALRAVEECR